MKTEKSDKKNEQPSKEDVGIMIGAMMMTFYGQEAGFEMFKEFIEPEIDKK